ncbi:MAG: RNA-binding protein [Clostridia bacterium]
MINRQEILESLRTGEDRMFVSKILDQTILSLKYHEIRFTHYLDPFQQKLVVGKLGLIPGLGMSFFGGYGEAERKLISFYPDYMTAESIKYPLSILQVSGTGLDKLSHRDFLGAILSLGIKREKIGDILVHANLSYIFTMNDIAQYIIMNLSKVANTSVSIEEKSDSNILIPEKNFKEIHSTVASLRLDTVLSTALGCSRTKVLPLIQSEKVSVNWECIHSPSYILKEGDIISVRGQGRVALDYVGGLTRKERISITVKRFI